MPSNNGKYYVKKKSNVQSKNIATLFGKPLSKTNDDEPRSSTVNSVVENNDDEPGPSAVNPVQVLQDHEEDIISLTSVLGKRKVHAIEETSANKTVPPPRKPHDLRLKSVERYENLFPDFFYSSSKQGWFCKICTSFAPGKKSNRSFIEAPGLFADHPTERSNDHLSSNRHQTALKNKKRLMNYLREIQMFG